MLFSTPIFLFVFFPGAILLHSICPRNARNALLVALSLLFYAWGELLYVGLLLGSIALNYIVGRLIAYRPERKKALLWYGIAVNLLVLGIFKYADFLTESVHDICGLQIATLALHLPIGISFFTFQAISYLVDVYRGKTHADRNLVDVALYIAFFPQLIAGPIIRYNDIVDQIRLRSTQITDREQGLKRFIIGLSKKVLLANTVAIVPDTIFAADPATLSTSTAWFGVFCYSLQIYFDFSGYSDMAIGLGRMFGFRIPENFDYPYIAHSITDFWRRWHISLTTWFKDYVYIPMGGNRGSLMRTAANLIAVFLLSGLWHGASWNFVLWGLLFGVCIAGEKVWSASAPTWRAPLCIGHTYALAIVLCSWVLFRSPSLAHAAEYYSAMVGLTSGSTTIAQFLDREILVVAMVAVVACTPVWTRWWKRMHVNRAVMVATDAGYIGLLLLCISEIAVQTYQPFIYFQF